jgi:hypothetical protein
LLRQAREENGMSPSDYVIDGHRIYELETRVAQLEATLAAVHWWAKSNPVAFRDEEARAELFRILDKEQHRER